MASSSKPSVEEKLVVVRLMVAWAVTRCAGARSFAALSKEQRSVISPAFKSQTEESNTTLRLIRLVNFAYVMYDEALTERCPVLDDALVFRLRNIEKDRDDVLIKFIDELILKLFFGRATDTGYDVSPKLLNPSLVTAIDRIGTMLPAAVQTSDNSIDLCGAQRSLLDVGYRGWLFRNCAVDLYKALAIDRKDRSDAERAEPILVYMLILRMTRRGFIVASNASIEAVRQLYLRNRHVHADSISLCRAIRFVIRTGAVVMGHDELVAQRMISVEEARRFDDMLNESLRHVSCCANETSAAYQLSLAEESLSRHHEHIKRLSKPAAGSPSLPAQGRMHQFESPRMGHADSGGPSLTSVAHDELMSPLTPPQPLPQIVPPMLTGFDDTLGSARGRVDVALPRPSRSRPPTRAVSELHRYSRTHLEHPPREIDRWHQVPALYQPEIIPDAPTTGAGAHDRPSENDPLAFDSFGRAHRPYGLRRRDMDLDSIQPGMAGSVSDLSSVHSWNELLVGSTGPVRAAESIPSIRGSSSSRSQGTMSLSNGSDAGMSISRRSTSTKSSLVGRILRDTPAPSGSGRIPEAF